MTEDAEEELKEYGDRIEKEFREKLNMGQITGFGHLVILLSLHTIIPKERYVALLQDTADIMVEQFKKKFKRDELENCYEQLSHCLAVIHGPNTSFEPYEIECELHIRKFLHVLPP